MARSRNIKPGFFANDLLSEINPLGRLLFIGLWTIADREGRLEDRDKKIKAQVLPYDDCDVDELLSDLETRGFIQRYKDSNNRLIQITKWEKHQQPHPKEQASIHPAPAKTVACPLLAGCLPVASSLQEPLLAHLIPDSFNLIPDSLVPSTDLSLAPSGSAPLKVKAKAKIKTVELEPLVVTYLIGDESASCFERVWSMWPQRHHRTEPRMQSARGKRGPGEKAWQRIINADMATPEELVSCAVAYLTRHDHGSNGHARDISTFYGPELEWKECLKVVREEQGKEASNG